jgi:hypothetical protein
MEYQKKLKEKQREEAEKENEGRFACCVSNHRLLV